MSKHTPGPWFYTYDNDTRGGFHSWYDIESGDEKIGEIYTEVNALLIAAAPDLLEALEEIKKETHSNKEEDVNIVSFTNMYNSLSRIYTLANNAIAKATE